MYVSTNLLSDCRPLSSRRKLNQPGPALHSIPKGTILIGNTYGIHHDPKRFPEPNVFRPERFADFPLSAPEYAAMAGDESRDHYGYGW